MRRVHLFAFAAWTLLGAAGCGDDDESSTSGDIDRYCQLTAELDAAGEAAVEEADEDADEIAVL